MRTNKFIANGVAALGGGRLLRKRLAKTYIFMASNNIRIRIDNILCVKEAFKLLENKKIASISRVRILCVAGIYVTTITVIKTVLAGGSLGAFLPVSSILAGGILGKIGYSLLTSKAGLLSVGLTGGLNILAIVSQLGTLALGLGSVIWGVSRLVKISRETRDRLLAEEQRKVLAAREKRKAAREEKRQAEILAREEKRQAKLAEEAEKRAAAKAIEDDKKNRAYALAEENVKKRELFFVKMDSNNVNVGKTRYEWETRELDGIRLKSELYSAFRNYFEKLIDKKSVLAYRQVHADEINNLMREEIVLIDQYISKLNELLIALKLHESNIAVASILFGNARRGDYEGAATQIDVLGIYQQINEYAERAKNLDDFFAQLNLEEKEFLNSKSESRKKLIDKLMTLKALYLVIDVLEEMKSLNVELESAIAIRNEYYIEIHKILEKFLG